MVVSGLGNRCDFQPLSSYVSEMVHEILKYLLQNTNTNWSVKWCNCWSLIDYATLTSVPPSMIMLTVVVCELLFLMCLEQRTAKSHLHFAFV